MSAGPSMSTRKITTGSHPTLPPRSRVSVAKGSTKSLSRSSFKSLRLWPAPTLIWTKEEREKLSSAGPPAEASTYHQLFKTAAPTNSSHPRETTLLSTGMLAKRTTTFSSHSTAEKFPQSILRHNGCTRLN